MTSLSTTSLYIPRIRRCFTEDMIINIFWKHNLGKVYRVDFEAITYDPPGTWDFEFQKACVYLETGHSWDSEITKSLEICGTYKLNHPNFDGSIETWLMHVNHNPIPKANTLMNIHQLMHENRLLRAKIQELLKSK